MRIFLSLILAVTLMSSAVMAQTSPEKKALILKFLDVSGIRDSLNENVNMMILQIPQDQAQKVAKVREAIKVDEIVERLVPIYDRNFTSEELQGLINFYTSPLGQKFLQKLPEVIKASIQINAQYMESKLGINTSTASSVTP